MIENELKRRQTVGIQGVQQDETMNKTKRAFQVIRMISSEFLIDESYLDSDSNRSGSNAASNILNSQNEIRNTTHFGDILRFDSNR